MCSGSPINLFVEIPFISDDDLDFAFELDRPSTSANASLSENLSMSEDAAPQPIHQSKAAFPAAKLLHGRSPLGLATPIVADDLKIVFARPARILQLISEERRIAQPLSQISRSGAPDNADQWKSLKAEPPHPIATEPPVHKRSNSQRRNSKRNTEPPLARCLVKDFSMKFYRRRVVELALGQGLARRFEILKLDRRRV